MLLPDHPALRLRLKPHFADGAATHLSVTYTIPPSEPPSAGPLLLYETFYGNVPSHPYRVSDVRASDTAGPLPLRFIPTEQPDEQEWRLATNPTGDVTFRMDVFPRNVDITTPLGARVDLRTDQGGLMGAGRWFLPRVARPGTFTNIVEWDLSLAPSDEVRATWSFGEGPGPIIATGPATTLTNTVYMVGPIRSYPSTPLQVAEPGHCGCYWFGELPANLDRLKGFNTELFRPMAQMFAREGDSYRVFIRSTALGFGGTGFDASYVLEYDPETANEKDEEVRGLFAHEMVHSFALMDIEKDDDNSWYTEGIAEFYGILLPYRFGITSASSVARAVTNKLGGYYTNPDMHLSMKDAAERFFSTWYAEKIPYNRGFAYLLLVDARLRRLAGVDDPKSASPLDGIVLDLARRRERGENVVARDWLRALGACLDGETDYEAEFRGMLAGDTVALDGDSFVGSAANRLTPTKHRVLQFGFDREAVRRRQIESVVVGSEAERAGLRAGDGIVRHDRGGKVQEDTEATYSMTVERDGEKMDLEWLPREKREVECWELKSLIG